MTARLGLRGGRAASTPGIAFLSALLFGLLSPRIGIAAQPVEFRSPPSAVILVTLDTVRADHTSLWAPERGTTPHLAQLAAEGVQFRQAYSPSATTGPAHASLFTGLYPAWHGVRKNGVPLREDVRTLAEIFQAAGYRTAAFVSSFVLSKRFGYAQGFDVFDDEFDAEGATLVLDAWEGIEMKRAFDRRGNVTMDRALAFLDGAARDDAPVFLFIHLFDPHTPYVPPAAYAAQMGVKDSIEPDAADLIRRYDAEIAFADAQLGRLMAALAASKRWSDALVVVSADHGEGLMEKGLAEHGARLWESLVHVPLVVRWPGRIAPGTDVGVPVSWIDLFASLANRVAARDATEEKRAESNASDVLETLLFSDAEERSAPPIFFHRRPYAPGTIDTLRVEGERFAVRSGRFKWVGAGDGESAALYDVSLDPAEEVNLNRPDAKPEHRDIAASLSATLENWRNGFPAPSSSEIAPPLREQLKVLGYGE